MANFDETAADLPDEDKDGNTINNANPLTLEDVLVRIIERSDPVLGMPASGILSAPADSPYNWALLGLVLRDIFLDEKIDGLQDEVDNLDLTVANASESARGIIEIANQTEGRGGSDDNRAMTSERTLDALRNGGNFAASTSRRGTVEFATDAEAQDENNSTKALTAASLYREEDLQTSDISLPHSNVATVTFSNISHTGFGIKYFGPINIDEDYGTITFSGTMTRTSNSGTAFIRVDINGITFSDFSWTISGGNLTQMISGSSLQIDNPDTTTSPVNFTVIGTPI